jgi:hypothetical protein
MTARTESSPLRQALIATGKIAVLGVIIRYVWGAYDPEMRTWAFAAAAPVAGLHTYLQASGRLGALATMLIAMGIGGLLLWTAVLLFGWIPTTRGDIPYVIGVFAFPAGALALGLYQRRQLRSARQTSTA